jgi:hypothetical protein
MRTMFAGTAFALAFASIAAAHRRSILCPLNRSCPTSSWPSALGFVRAGCVKPNFVTGVLTPAWDLRPEELSDFTFAKQGGLDLYFEGHLGITPHVMVGMMFSETTSSRGGTRRFDSPQDQVNLYTFQDIKTRAPSSRGGPVTPSRLPPGLRSSIGGPQRQVARQRDVAIHFRRVLALDDRCRRRPRVLTSTGQWLSRLIAPGWGARTK